jgi:ABC-type transport system substrate-binding protein
MYEGLLTYGANLESLPGLATGWEISRDGLTYTFVLRSGAKFHNGKTLLPEDVKWSIGYAQDPKNNAFGRADLTIIKEIEIVEPDRIRIHLKSSFSPFLSALTGIHLFSILPKDSIQTEEKPQNFPAGTGPFRFVQWKPGQELRVARFDGYWQKGLPYVDEVRFITVSDETSKFNAIRVGDLDMAEEIPMVEIPQIRDGKGPGVKLALSAAGNHPRLGINHCQPPFNHPKVRQAFAYALDKQEILDGAYSGLGVPTNQKLIRGTRWFISELNDRKQDAAKARALLAEAGYPDGVKVTLIGWTGTDKQLQIIQSQVKKAGFDAKLEIRDFATHTSYLTKRDFQISMSGGATASDPDLTYYGYYHTPVPGAERGGRIQPCYSNRRVDELLEEARRIADFAQRRAMYKEVIQILHEEVADIPIGFVPNGFALRSYVQGFQPTINDDFLSYSNGGFVTTWLDR